jgi:hypothetical protein
MKSVMVSQDSRYPCSICGTDAEAGVNVMTMAGETFSKVAATFGVGRSAVYRHRKHFAERILLDRGRAKKLMLNRSQRLKAGTPLAMWEIIGATSTMWSIQSLLTMGPTP